MFQSNNLERKNTVTTSNDLCNGGKDNRTSKLVRSSTPQKLDETWPIHHFQDNPSDIVSDISYSNLNAATVNDILQEAPIYANPEGHNFLSSTIGNLSLVHNDDLTEYSESPKHVTGNRDIVIQKSPNPEDVDHHVSHLPSQNLASQGNVKSFEGKQNKSECDSYSSMSDETVDHLCQNHSNYYHLASHNTLSQSENSENLHCYTDASGLATDGHSSNFTKSSDTNHFFNQDHSQNHTPKIKKCYLWENPKHSKNYIDENVETSNQSELSIPPSFWDTSAQSITSQRNSSNAEVDSNKSHWISVSDESYDNKNDTEQEPSEYRLSGIRNDIPHEAVLCHSNTDSNCQDGSVRPKIHKNITDHISQNESEGYISTLNDQNHEAIKNTQVTIDKYDSSEYSGNTDDNSQDISIHSENIYNYSQGVSSNQGMNNPRRYSYHFQEGRPLFGNINHNLTSISTSRSNQNVRSKSLLSDAERRRRGSGSWTGVNESDDEVEQISRINQSPINLSQTSDDFNDMRISTSHEMQNSFQSSYQNSVNSCRPAVEGMVPHRGEVIDEENIKYRLNFYFKNPLEKYKTHNRFPWKLMFQVIKIIICTIQLGMFASQRYSHVTYLWDTKVSLSHLFIKSWDSTREVVAYPPSTGPLAVYTVEEFYGFLDFSIHSFSEIETTAVGAYKYQRRKNMAVVMPEFCMTKYKNGFSNVHSLSFNLDNSIRTECFSIPALDLNETETFSIEEFLAAKNRTINFDLLLEASFSFNLETVKLRSDFPYETPECYRLETLIYYDNNDHDGQMLVDLDIGAKVLDCEGNVTDSSSTDAGMNPFRIALNVSTITVCAISLVLCLRALFRAQLLKSEVNSCFRYRFGRDLDRWESFEFVNLWYVLICINDILIIVGSVIKMSLEGQDYEGYLDKWNVCSLCLGTGNLFIWFGCLRYFGFFETYNVLILTMKHCIPNVCRYSICTLMVFAGYSLCGWLVLGPYHIKFRSLSTTLECLFSLINGDDMFATFSSTLGKDLIVWWFSRLYIYSFTSLFIYVILSLAIAIITDTYYTVQTWYKVGYPETELRKYASSCREDAACENNMRRSFRDVVSCLFCCCDFRGWRSRRSERYQPIPTNEE